MKLPQLSKREKILAALVFGIFFLLINLFMLSNFFRQQRLLHSSLAARQNDLNNIQMMLSERELWERREAWLQNKQPKMTSEGSAGVQLLDQVRQIARATEVTLENPVISTPERTAFYHSVPVNVETRSSWAALIKFLHAVQQPEQFHVFENANIQIDSQDATKMRGRFRIARWYAL
jgi:Tfp pilus assembly protein PilO